MNLLCKWFDHKWSNWQNGLGSYRVRDCLRCGVLDYWYE